VTKIPLFKVMSEQEPKMGFELRKKRKFKKVKEFTKRIKKM